MASSSQAAMVVSPERSAARQRSWSAEAGGDEEREGQTASDAGRARPTHDGRRVERLVVRGARRARAALDDDAGGDREPGPGEQRRAQVVAADARVQVRRREQAGDRDGDARQQRVARVAQGGHDERRRHEPRRGCPAGRRRTDEPDRLGREVREPLDVALELAGQHDVPEAAQVSGCP